MCNGSSGPSCTPEPKDETCDGLDGDCDSLIDEDYVIDDTCGVGVCQTNNTPSSCVDGVETTCQPGSPTEATDVTCDGLDGDCDDSADEDYVPTPSSCGIGACTSTGQFICQSGSEVDTCTPSSPSPEICDGILSPTDVDNDGDGYAVCANDCNDADPDIHPGAVELCNGMDDNCNYTLPVNERDLDEKGVKVCDTPSHCDDFDATTSPNEPEICGDSTDNDCDGQIDTVDPEGCI